MVDPGRFWAKVQKSEGCWEWTGAHRSDGYGNATRLDRKPTPAHRVAYELVVGPIPPGLQIDHLCRNRGCVNPAHMEPVTNRENVLRGESPIARTIRAGVCKRGHPRNAENLYVYASGTTRCRPCALANYHQHKHRHDRSVAALRSPQ